MTQAAALSPEYVLLGFLNQQPAHGHHLHEHMEAELGQKSPPAHSTLLITSG